MSLYMQRKKKKERKRKKKKMLSSSSIDLNSIKPKIVEVSMLGYFAML